MNPTHPPAEGELEHPAQAEDVIDLRKVVWVGLFSLMVFAIGIVWAYRIMAIRDPDMLGPGSTAGARRLGAQEIGIVDQVLFHGDRRLEVQRIHQDKRLHSWGWVDRQRGIIHMPIDEAMSRVLQGRGGPP